MNELFRFIGMMNRQCSAGRRDEAAREAAAGDRSWTQCTRKVDEAERAAAKSSEEGKANAAKAKKLKGAQAKVDAALQVNGLQVWLGCEQLCCLPGSLFSGDSVFTLPAGSVLG